MTCPIACEILDSLQALQPAVGAAEHSGSCSTHTNHMPVSQQLLTLLVQVSHSNNVKEVTPDILQMSTSSNYPIM